MQNTAYIFFCEDSGRFRKNGFPNIILRKFIQANSRYSIEDEIIIEKKMLLCLFMFWLAAVKDEFQCKIEQRIMSPYNINKQSVKISLFPFISILLRISKRVIN